jgi:hypothetical protein
MITEVSLLHPLPDPTNSSYAVVKEKVMTDVSGITLKTDSFLCEVYLEKINYLVESGIIDNLKSYFNPKKRSEKGDPSALSIDHLLIWFQLWAALLMVTVLFFLLEILMAKLAKILIKKAVRTVKQLWRSYEDIDQF